MPETNLKDLYEELRGLVRTASFDDERLQHDLKARGRTVRIVTDELHTELTKLGLPGTFDIKTTDITCVKALVQLAECFDYYGRFDKAAAISLPGEGILDSLPQHKSNQENRQLRQSHIRLAVSYARSLYRRHEFDHAEALLMQCREYVETYLRTNDYPNFGTLGEIAYTLGRLYREGQQYDSAKREFNTAIKFYEKRAHRNLSLGVPSDDKQFSFHKVATIAALGLSKCNYTTGALSTALYGNLASARLVLQSTGDILNCKYADVIHASCVRALEGRERADLKGLTVIVQSAIKVFHNYGHDFYQAGALLELAYISLAERDFDAALKICSATKELTRKSDFLWNFEQQIVRSRAFQHKGDFAAAKRAATAAFKLAEQRDDRVAQVEALMVRSNAYLPSEQSLAIKDLRLAMQLNKSDDDGMEFLNPRIHGECSIRMADHYFDLDDKENATKCFEDWEKLSPTVENARLHKLAEETGRKLGKGKTFVVDFGEVHHYKMLERRFRKSILIYAGKRFQTVSCIADALKIQRPKVYRWLKEFGDDQEVKSLGIKVRPKPKKRNVALKSDTVDGGRGTTSKKK